MVVICVAVEHAVDRTREEAVVQDIDRSVVHVRVDGQPRAKRTCFVNTGRIARGVEATPEVEVWSN